MAQFYAQSQDHDRCVQSSVSRAPITVTGLTIAGKLAAFTGTVQSVETGHTAFRDYPLRITMPDAEQMNP